MVQLIKENKLFLWFYGLFIAVMLAYLIQSEQADLVLWMSHHRTELLNYFFMTMTRFGEEIAYISVAVVFLFVKYKETIMVGMTGLMVMILAFVLKWFFAAPRPKTILADQGRLDDYVPIEGVRMLVGETGFPSGHTAGGFALMVFLAIYFKNVWLDLLCVIIAILVGLSRIYLGHHTVDDVVFGSLVGFMLGLLMQYGALHLPWPKWAESNLMSSFKANRLIKS